MAATATAAPMDDSSSMARRLLPAVAVDAGVGVGDAGAD